MACCIASATAAFNKYTQRGMAWCRSHVLHGAATPAAEQTSTGQATHQTVCHSFETMFQRLTGTSSHSLLSTYASFMTDLGVDFLLPGSYPRPARNRSKLCCAGSYLC